MRTPVAWALLFSALSAAGLAPALAQDESPRAVSCFENWTAVLRLNQLERAIALCSQVIDDPVTAAATRGQALGQRGLLRARRYVAIEVAQEAVQGIADITEGLRLHTPPEERRLQLLIVRAHSMSPPATRAARPPTIARCWTPTRAIRWPALACGGSARRKRNSGPGVRAAL